MPAFRTVGAGRTLLAGALTGGRFAGAGAVEGRGRSLGAGVLFAGPRAGGLVVAGALVCAAGAGFSLAGGVLPLLAGGFVLWAGGGVFFSFSSCASKWTPEANTNAAAAARIQRLLTATRVEEGSDMAPLW